MPCTSEGVRTSKYPNGGACNLWFCRWSICLYCTTAPLKGIHVTPTPPCHSIFFFCQRILQGSLSKPPCSLLLALGSVLVEGISQHFALSMWSHQSSGPRLVSTGHQDGRQKLRSFDQSPWQPTLAWQWNTMIQMSCLMCSVPTRNISNYLDAYTVRKMHWLSRGRGDGVEPCVQVSGVVYSNCNTGSQAANPVKWTSAR